MCCHFEQAAKTAKGGKRQATTAGAIHCCRCGARDAAEQLQPHVQLARDVPDALQLRDPAAVDEHVADDTAAARCVCPIDCQLAHRRSPYARRPSRGPGRLRGGADASAHSLYLSQLTNAIRRDDQPGMRPSCAWSPGVAGVDDWRSSESACDVCQPRGQPSDRMCAHELPRQRRSFPAAAPARCTVRSIGRGLVCTLQTRHIVQPCSVN